MWLDSGELSLIGERAGVVHAELLAALERNVGAAPRVRGGKRRCPVCGKVLRRVRTPGDKPVTLDRCPRAHGLWFDQEEMESVVAAAGADESNDLVRLLKDLADERRKGRVNGMAPDGFRKERMK